MKITKTGTTIVAASLVVAGCAAPGGTTVPQMTRVNYYPQCYQSVAMLRQQDQQFQQAMAVNTLSGAAGGAALGEAVDDRTDRDRPAPQHGVSRGRSPIVTGVGGESAGRRVSESATPGITHRG